MPVSKRMPGGLFVNLMMARVYAPFPMTSTIGDLTFYMMDGVNYVRIKSSLTRKRVLKSPDFRKTRLYAGFMAQASKIGSVIYQALPHDWRQGWMYRAFTGEALQLLKEGKTVEETTRVLWERYVEALHHHGEDRGAGLQAALDSVAVTPRGTRKKKDARVQRLQRYSDLLAEASKMASELYKSLPVEKRKIGLYQAWVSEAMRFLRQDPKPYESQSPVSCHDTAPGQSLPAAGKALVQASADLESMIPIIQSSVTTSTRSVKPPGKGRLFYIPPVNRTSPKRFAPRRTHHVLLVTRSP